MQHKINFNTAHLKKHHRHCFLFFVRKKLILEVHMQSLVNISLDMISCETVGLGLAQLSQITCVCQLFPALVFDVCANE